MAKNRCNLYTDYNGSSKAIANTSAQTITFTGTDLPGAGVVAFHFYTTGSANNKLANFTRIRVKANSQTIWDFDPVHYRAFIERVSRANFAYAATATRFTIPFYIPDGKGDMRYASQFPKNAIPTIEIVTNASVATGTVVAGWTRCDMKPLLYPKFLGQVLNAAAGPTTNFGYPLSLDGEIRGYSIPTTGLNRVKLTLDDVVRHQVDGTLILEDQQLENPVTISDPIFHKLHGTQGAPPGRSNVQLDLGSSWAGVGNEVTIWSFHKQGEAA
jgi:hypothetical protein